MAVKKNFTNNNLFAIMIRTISLCTLGDFTINDNSKMITE